MPYQKERRLLTRIGRQGVVTTRELAAELSTTPREAARVARRLESRGFLQRVRRGVYAAIPLEADQENFRPDPFLSVHAVLGPGHAFSHYSALTLLGLSHQEHQTIHVTKPGARARRLRVADRMLHVHNSGPNGWESATTRRTRGSKRLLATTPERTLVDLLSLPPHRQDYGEIVHVYRSVLRISEPADLVTKGRLWGTKAGQARLGHLFIRYPNDEGNQADLFEEKTEVNITLKSPTYFGTKPNNPGNRFDSAFNVVYPGGM